MSLVEVWFAICHQGHADVGQLCERFRLLIRDHFKPLALVPDDVVSLAFKSDRIGIGAAWLVSFNIDPRHVLIDRHCSSILALRDCRKLSIILGLKS